MKPNDIIEFTRAKPFKFLKKVGEGALGKTVLLQDETIDEQFVCKKYEPYHGVHKEDYFEHFKNEIKLLHLLYHNNIVRVFNYYLYPEKFLGYILMEYIDGTDIESYVKKYPEKINTIFEQTISGFRYLEEHDILHRDIRPYNIMVTNGSIVKIIDFGFGKKIQYEQDFDKSISLNWWCDTPNDFLEKKYDFRTEVYFIGKLFEKLLLDNQMSEFKYKELLNRMIPKATAERIESFQACDKYILKQQFSEIKFSDLEVQAYRSFSDTLYQIISKVEYSTKFIHDTDKVINKLESLHQNIMLEEYLYAPNKLIECFINGEFFYSKNNLIMVSEIYSFINLIKNCSHEKRNIIINNLETKIDALPKYSNELDISDDEIPF